MNNKRLLNHIPNKTAIRGFSILEFLVASLLSMIVLMAVSSTYFTARGLNKSANARIGIQQDLRNTANMIVRDARMAGNFGCFNMANFPASAVIEDKSSDEYTLKTAGVNNLLPVKEINKLSYSSFAQTGKDPILLFQYGIDKADSTEKTAIASSCSGIAKPHTEIKDLAAAKLALKITDSDQDGSIAIMKHEIIAYAVGKLGEESGLFRFQLSNDGSWSNPQLLIKGITAMDIHYIYAECSDSENASASGANAETFKYADQLDTSIEAKSPASIQIVLNNGSIDLSKEQDNKVDIYNINATIRGGNVCADRSL
ncbi:pilus assembly protein PilW [Neisseria sp. HMSC075C10]|uniref:PilW family protein n=1 Tax=unclassified Neisseria TaxID=2623750 RepID=UPI0008A3A49D|nr:MULTISPECIES: pilus assembly protein PilW [unclassified Neisseria]OFO39174.1 pilus assembly protein PilW [Neisseria sp. HMSC075C10]OHQ57946.1 pilus assembly protein PilW [Neisseria sp. HMSC070H10]